MDAKFNTTSSVLFNKENSAKIPEWMENIADNLMIKDKHLDIDFGKPVGSFAENKKVNRKEGDASLRKIAYSYDENKLVVESKIQLAKFLSGKYYNVKNVRTGANSVTLEVIIDGVPSLFEFPFEVQYGKLKTASTFFANNGEYPFSKAGLMECLEDIKNNRTKTPKVVEAVGKTYLINREEIIRRFNGSLRQATDRINELLEKGIIVGAGSNTYASYYDIDQLFPQMEKEAAEPKLPEFHYVPNKEHVEANPIKSANVLTIEASKILSQYFKDFVINNSVRDGDELLVKATVLADKTNVRQTVDFSFNIEKERVTGIKVAEINDKRMSISQLLDYLNHSNNILEQYSSFNQIKSNKMYDSIVFTKRDVKEKLNKVISASKVDKLIESWVAKKLISPINSTTFATKYSFEELLSKTVVAKLLSDEEIEKIKAYQQHFGEGLEINRDEKAILDKVREASDAVTSDEIKLANLQNKLTTQFRNFSISDFNPLDSDRQIYKANLNFVHNGVRNKVEILAEFNSQNVSKIIAKINGKEIPIEKLVQAFKNSPLLSAYLNNNNNKNLVASKIILTKDLMRRKLANVVSANEIDEVINYWLNNNLLENIGENKYASKHSFEELLEMSNFMPISEKELANRIEKQRRDKMLEIKSSHIKDTGSRQVEETWSSERMAIYASQQIGSMFKDYELLDANLTDEHYEVTARIVNPIDGLKKKLKFTFAMVNGVPKDLVKLSDGKIEVEPQEILSLLETKDDAVKQYVQINKAAKRNYKNIISKNQLESKLAIVMNKEDISSTIDYLVDNNVITKINSQEFASDKSITEIINYLSSHSKVDLESGKYQLKQAIRDEHKIDLRGQHVIETDTRPLERKEEQLSPQMKKLQSKIKQTIITAQKAKKITENKSLKLQEQLELAKTANDLEQVFKELKKYL